MSVGGGQGKREGARREPPVERERERETCRVREARNSARRESVQRDG